MESLADLEELCPLPDELVNVRVRSSESIPMTTQVSIFCIEIVLLFILEVHCNQVF